MPDSNDILSKMLLLQHRGKVKGPVLAAEIGVSEVTLRSIVKELRREGYPITSDNEGYGWAKNIDEMKPTLAHLKSRAMSELVTINKLERNFIVPNSQDGFFKPKSVLEEIIEEVRKL